jgi:glycerol-3-phosphate dehydrogenase (NAD(P)+)
MKESASILDIKIGVVGAGSWGTALANLLADKGYVVSLWVFEPEVEQQILNERENKVFLPGVKLSERLMPSGDLAMWFPEKTLCWWWCHPMS